MADTALVVPESTIPGTKAWAETVVANAKRYAGFAEKDVRPLVERYRALCDHRAWETWFPDEPRTLARFCREVLGYEAEFLETMSAGVAVLEKDGYSGPVSVRDALDAVAAQVRAREARKDAIAAADAVPLPGRGRPRKSGNAAFNVRVTGNNAGSESYLRRRLKRDKPELYAEVASGTKSAHAAAVEAGIRKATVTIRADDPVRAAETLRKTYKNPEDRVILAERLLAEGED